MSIQSDLAGIKAVEDTLTANRVANFAYTNTAYDNNDADGVSEYNVENEQNIPVGTASVMKVNSTVIAKGFRAQASSVTRMLLDHFLGRLSYNLNKVNDNMSSLLVKLNANLGVADGLATLGSDGRLLYAQRPFCESFTYIVDSNASLLTWLSNTSGNDYTSVLIKRGIWTYSSATEPISLTTIGTKYIEGEVGSIIRVSSDITKFLYFDTYSFTSKTPQINKLQLQTNTTPVLIQKATGVHNVNLCHFNPDYSSVAHVALYVVGTIDSGLLYSEDAVNFQASNVTSGVFHSVGYNIYSKKWVACKTQDSSETSPDNSGAVYYSLNGKNWLETNAQNLSAAVFSYFPSICFVTTLQGILYSLDGGSVYSPTSVTEGLSQSGVKEAPNGVGFICAVTESTTMNGILYSQDGVTWQATNVTSGNFSLETANGVSIASDRSSAKLGVAISSDGLHWTFVQDMLSARYEKACFGKGVWCLGLDTGSNAYRLAYSTDNGSHWTLGESRSDDYSYIYFINNIFLAGSGSGGGILFSTDGKNWEATNITTNYYMYFSYAGKFVCGAIINGQVQGVTLLYSNDGRYWFTCNNGSVQTQCGDASLNSTLTNNINVHNCITQAGLNNTADFEGKAVNSIADTAEGGFNYIID